MFWAAIWKTGTPIFPMELDPDAPRGGVSAKSYMKTLEEGLLPMYNGIGRFQQNNAKIHNAVATLSWFMPNGVELLE